MYYVSNAFSLNMLAKLGGKIKVTPITVEQAREGAPLCRSIVGHPDTARVFAEVLKVDIPFNRESVALVPGDFLLVGQYRGPRLQEGATKLPEGASIEWALLNFEG